MPEWVQRLWVAGDAQAVQQRQYALALKSVRWQDYVTVRICSVAAWDVKWQVVNTYCLNIFAEQLQYVSYRLSWEWIKRYRYNLFPGLLVNSDRRVEQAYPATIVSADVVSVVTYSISSI